MTAVGRRAKIVCTLGPATSSDEQVARLVEAGMDIARLNFSHGDRADHERIYRTIRAAADASGRAVGILADLQGPKIRLGRFAAGPVNWQTGEIVRITVDEVAGTHDRVSTTYKGLAQDAQAGDRLLVDDGRVGLTVLEVDGTDVVCRIDEGGTVSDNKGISLPGMNVSVPALSEKDIADLEFALGLSVDFIALSFVRSPQDIDLVHEIMDKVGQRLPVIAKLEKPEAVQNLEAVINAFDGVMVARGDLGVELPPEEVPLVQKRIVQAARIAGKPVVVATQMLESMISAPSPTRAEASDVATAVFDGADAVMLSAETAAGQYPFEAVNIMDRIVARVEQDEDWRARMAASRPAVEPNSADAIAAAAVQVSTTIAAEAIVAYTSSGSTALRIARLRPDSPVLGLTTSLEAARRLALVWGVHAVVGSEVHSMTDAVSRATRVAQAEKFAESGREIIVAAGVPFGQTGSTNALRVARVK